ncbi:formate dehydrogenase accessory sulfurtransferase FdhD [Tuwongella immobilis]|uniref:Sulfur carrier protein FdhD n=1 Tax=Tuwongella immobilis TaxID=692036 RepID=A0A6C2YSG3_9BACT|nr:formate dehydrogenase accessory sulfurtransferase FdhD [Tuwongella immobilis]VIP04620.1 formate dehydrogenase : Protein FdhD homolog OS=Fibrella aestuarina BUZ 2 GN=fdhD PE=3 SV=1: FdhD-NarQ [Tuwongella immobilis]VTS06601.1 formate dehydrogenase : Protein FdhD homolog OS=Fibrella aestuarina BUZ 2 GN=fdhD PE=3 SV=1: FdhD-NarQ [Tuwongella immobilis]
MPDDQPMLRIPIRSFRQTDSGFASHIRDDLLAVEEPLEIRLGFGPRAARQSAAISVTMRTPGHDRELALGFLFNEAVLTNAQSVEDWHSPTRGVIQAELAPDVRVDLNRLHRNVYTTSSCGVCGKASLDAVAVALPDLLDESGPTIAPELLLELPAKLRQAQAVFEQTGGLHASALFDSSGQLLAMREDVGRHNALDKLIGWALESGQIPLRNSVLLVSGRVSFELTQKALMAGIPILAAVGAPSSLAVELADSQGQTLVGFLRDGRYNVYTGAARLGGLSSLGADS